MQTPKRPGPPRSASSVGSQYERGPRTRLFLTMKIMLLRIILAMLILFSVAMFFYAERRSKFIASEVNLPLLAHELAAFKGGGSNLNDHFITSQRHELRHAERNESYDGYFNGLPLVFRSTQGRASLVHCVGDNFQESEAWLERSCKFSFLCFDTARNDFVLFRSQREERLAELLKTRPHWHVSATTMVRAKEDNTTIPHEIAIGGINRKWLNKGIQRLKWYPRVQTVSDSTVVDYYELPDDVVMVPFHSLSGKNPGHLMWDDFLPIYTLLSMYEMQKEGQAADAHRLLLLRYILPGPGLWASCDAKEESTRECHYMMNKFNPLMTGKNATHFWSTIHDFVLTVAGDTPRSPLVCARQGLAGLGSLTDHGHRKMHGWEPEDYLFTHNHGRGQLLYNFRNFMLSNMGIPIEPVRTEPPFKIAFSYKSSELGSRSADFVQQARALATIPDVEVSRHILKSMSLEEQVRVIAEANVFITYCGGGAATAMFLPAGATLIVFYDEKGGFKNNKLTKLPAMLDWDLINNLSHLRIHWVPGRTRNNQHDIDALVNLVRLELDLLTSSSS